MSNNRLSIIINDFSDENHQLLSAESCITQRTDFQYEVIVNLFGEEKREQYEELISKNDNEKCELKLKVHKKIFKNNPAAANNLGAYYSDSPLLLFMDQNMILNSYFLLEVLKKLGNKYYIRCSKIILEDDEIRESFLNDLKLETGLVKYSTDLFNKYFNRINTVIPWGLNFIAKRHFLNIAYDPKIFYVQDRDFDERFSYYLRINFPSETLNVLPDNYFAIQILDPKSPPTINRFIKIVDDRAVLMKEYLFVNQKEIKVNFKDEQSLLKDIF